MPYMENFWATYPTFLRALAAAVRRSAPATLSVPPLAGSSPQSMRKVVLFPAPVSYTHLDVYKRQNLRNSGVIDFMDSGADGFKTLTVTGNMDNDGDIPGSFRMNVSLTLSLIHI